MNARLFSPFYHSFPFTPLPLSRSSCLPAKSWLMMQSAVMEPASHSTTTSSLHSSSLFSSASSIDTMDSSPKEAASSPEHQNGTDFEQQQQHRPLHHRGRSNRKRSESTEEYACVIAFLVRGETSKQKEKIEKIQSIRRMYDQAYIRWEPHLTLIPPFIIPFSASPLCDDEQPNINIVARKAEDQTTRNILNETLDEICNTIQSICKSLDQHDLILDQVGHFTLKRYDTIHLRPSHLRKDDAFLQLQSQLELALPQAMQNLRNKGKASKDAYNPHLTLGQSFSAKGKKDIYELAVQAIAERPDKEDPLRIKVDKIQLMVKPVNRSGPYDVYKEFSLR